MGALRLEIAAGAVEEGLEAVRWYEARSVKAAGSFRLEIRLAFDRIRDSPLSWPHYHWGTRRLCCDVSPTRSSTGLRPTTCSSWPSPIRSSGQGIGGSEGCELRGPERATQQVIRLFRDELGSDARDAASGWWRVAVACWSSCRLAALLPVALALGCSNPETCLDTRQANANDAAPTREAAATPVGEAAATPTPAMPTPVTPIPVGEYFEIPAGPASPTEPLVVAGDVVPPVAIHRPSPEFTALGHVRVAGIPILSAVIAADGTVEQVRVVRPVHPDLDRAIVAAIEHGGFARRHCRASRWRCTTP